MLMGLESLMCLPVKQRELGCHSATVWMKWKKQVNIVVMECFYRSRLLNENGVSITGKAWISLRLGAEGHLDLAPGQSLCKALKILKIYSCRDGKSSRTKPSSRLVNLPLNETPGKGCVHEVETRAV